MLGAVRGGDPEAFGECFGLLYNELHRLAGVEMRRERRAGHTPIQTTDLVHKAYTRLIGKDHSAEDRSQFLLVAARAMRQLLVDDARWRKAEKRDGARARIELSDSFHSGRDQGLDLVELNDALEQLAERDPELVQVVELRFLAGLSEREVGETLGLSRPTVQRRWRTARAWLSSQLRPRDEEARDGR